VKYLFDTDHLSILQRQSGAEYVSIVEQYENHEDEIALSVVSFHEQVLGCHTYISKARDDAGLIRGYKMLGRVIQDFASWPVLLFDTQAATTFANLKAARVRIATMDLRIASIALSRNLVLVTRNHVDFAKVPNLRIEDWTR
jgi:tRNA(fMet)-specific endonuclease VapC